MLVKKTTVIIVEELPLSSPENSKTTGASAAELLNASKPKLLMEIHYMQGYQLQQPTINNLTNFLQQHLNKPGGVQVVQKEIAVTGGDPKSINEVAQIEQQYGTAFTTADQVAVYVLVTNSGFSSGNVLGVAYRNTSICLFGKTIQQNSGGIGQALRIKIESTVLNHEVGHLLGLVDLGTPMLTNHKDAAHDNHCNNSNCLMYYAAETTDILGVLITGNIPSLDINCSNDIKANGGK